MADADMGASRSGGTTAYIHNALGRGYASHLARYQAGEEADRSPYSFHRAEDLGFTVILSEDANNPALSFLSRLSRKILGFDIPHALANRGRLRRSDVVWTLTEREALGIAALFLLRLAPRRPIIASSVWVVNDWSRIGVLRKFLYRRLGAYFTHLTVQSAACLPLARSIFGKSSVELMYFGINTKTFPITSPRSREGRGPISIFAGGIDQTRDWNTLLKAFGNDDRFDVNIYCRWLGDEIAANYRNVTSFRAMSIESFVDKIRRADFVVIPMFENLYAGITLALNSASLGTPVIATRTGGVPTYFDESDVFYVGVDQPDEMRDVALRTDSADAADRARAAQRRFVERNYTSDGLMRQYAALTRQALSGEASSTVAAVSATTDA
jgi:glycosyltransferase involved in cell wall biosynthesis